MLDVTRPIHFALIDNGTFTEAAGQLLREKAAVTIGSFPQGPVTADLVPLPIGSKTAAAGTP
jgi:hypothetical protein